MGVEVEERGGAAGREAGELHERLSTFTKVCARLKVSTPRPGKASPSAPARPSNDAEAGAVGDLEADEGAQGAVSGIRAGVEVEMAQAAEAGHVIGAGRPRREGRRAVDAAAALRPIFVFEAGPAADAQAGVGARNVEEACSEGGAEGRGPARQRRGDPERRAARPEHDGRRDQSLSARINKALFTALYAADAATARSSTR